ncbi:MAG: DUF1080 domain-containing protein [Planctomycetales bacterium]|nr:DUF1080 domain-containing protein [Planctomycetales bacterium]
MEFKLTLANDDSGKLGGSVTVNRDGNEGEPAKLDDVKLDGNKLTFSYTRTRGDNTFTVHYDGVVTGDSIDGTIKTRFGDNDREFEWSAKRTAKAGPSWTSLFDGKTLEGWERIGNENSKWVVSDGAMTATGPASMLVNTSGPYKNFRYRAECKISDGGNSGLYFRTTRRPGFSDGYEAQIDSTHTDPIRTGSLYGMCHVYKQLVKPDTWFTYELEVRDDIWRGREMTRIKITVDGNELFEYMDFEKTFKQGHFAFQHHDPGSIVHIRKVEVMPLAD